MSKYIVIEGLDGTGKTTQFNNTLDFLGANTLGVREPGGTLMAEQIRTLLKSKDLPRSAHTNMFLFSAARTDLIDSVIRPAIKDDKRVVSDRCWLSTVAYQAAEGADVNHIVNLSKIATGELFEPDLLILIDLDPEVCRQRLDGRGGSEADFFDSKGLDYFKRVRHEYLNQAKQLKNAHIVDGKPSQDNVWKQIKDILKESV
ncbi:MAG: dTMP kinase [Candidatus Woesebacteria bacterium]|jgi:dTMP kinase